MMIDGLNIGEVARRAGIQPSAIRYYESVGLLSAPERIGGWRSYPTEVLDRLRLIRTARGMGFTLEELHILLDGFSDDTPPSERWRSLAAEKLPEVDDLIYRAQAVKRLLETGLRCECVRIEDCFGDDGCAVPVEASEIQADGCESENACSD